MKKAFSIFLAACLAISVTGCVSQGDMDAALAERDALKSENDILHATVDKYSDIFSAMDTEDYETAKSIVSEKQIAKEVAEKGNIDNYLVTVELTMDNFDDYFEWKVFYETNDFGEPMKDNVVFLLTSKVFDQGLVLYQTDAAVGYTMTTTDITSHGGKHTQTSDEQSNSFTQASLPMNFIQIFNGEHIADECYAEITRITGTVTFVKNTYVSSYQISQHPWPTIDNLEIRLVNGEIINRYVHYDYIF